MNKFFDPDGMFARVMNVILDLMLLNMLWLACCLPIVTAGASSTALYTVLIRLRDGKETKVLRSFFSAFVQNFRRATGVWLMLLLAAVICALDLYFANQMDSNAARVIAVVGLLLVAMTATFLFPLVARFENTWSNHLKNALLLSLSHAPRTLLALALWAGTVMLTILSVNTLYIMVLMWLMAGFSCLSYATLWIITPVLRKLEPAREEETEEV